MPSLLPSMAAPLCGLSARSRSPVFAYHRPHSGALRAQMSTTLAPRDSDVQFRQVVDHSVPVRGL